MTSSEVVFVWTLRKSALSLSRPKGKQAWIWLPRDHLSQSEVQDLDVKSQYLNQHLKKSPAAFFFLPSSFILCFSLFEVWPNRLRFAPHRCRWASMSEARGQEFGIWKRSLTWGHRGPKSKVFLKASKASVIWFSFQIFVFKMDF